MSERPRRRAPVARRGPVRQPRRRLDATAWVWIAAAALLVIVGALVVAGAYSQYYVPPRATVLQVGDRSFTMSYLVNRARYYLANFTARGFQVNPAEALTLTLDEMERDELLRQFGPSEGLTASDAEVDGALRKRVAVLAGRMPPETPGLTASTPSPGPAAEASPVATSSPGPFASDDEYRKTLADVLKAVRISEGELRDIVRAEVLLDKLRAQLGPKVPAQMPQVQILVILVPAKQQADRAKARLDLGEDFEAVQAEVSPQTVLPPAVTPSPAADASATPGAAATPAAGVAPPRQEPPWVTREMLLTPLADPAFNTPVGAVTDIVSTERGFAILKVVARDDAHPLDEGGREFYLTRAVDDWVKERRQKTTVKRSLDTAKTKWALDRLIG